MPFTISKVVKSHDVDRIYSFFLNAYIDYESARLLFLSGKLLAATVLANTAIEKYLKGFLVFHNKSLGKKHSIPIMLDSLKSLDPDFQPDYFISTEYSQVLEEIYGTRYLVSEIDNNNCYLISRNKHLAELDYIVNTLEHKISITDTLYKQNIIKKEPLLIKENYIINEQSKGDFVEKLDSLYIMGIINRKIIQLNVNNYPDTKNDNKFKYPNAFLITKFKNNEYEVKANI